MCAAVPSVLKKELLSVVSAPWFDNMLALRSIKSVARVKKVTAPVRGAEGGKRQYAGDASVSESKPFKVCPESAYVGVIL